VRRYRRVDTPASLGSNTTCPSGIPVSEVLKSRQPDLGHDAGAPHPRTLDLDTPTTERHLTTLVARTHRRPLQVAPALRNDIVDLLAHQLLERAQPNARAQRQQPLLRSPDQLAQRVLHAPWAQGLLHAPREHDLITRRLSDRYVATRGGALLDLWRIAANAPNRSGRGRRDRRHLKVLRAGCS
jgi:hypothetical protein